MCSRTKRPASIFEKSRDVIDDMAGVGSRGMDGIGIASLFVVELRGQEQLGHAEHTVHRGSDLVTHVGQELRLGRLAASAASLARHKASSVLLAFGNVLNERGELLSFFRWPSNWWRFRQEMSGRNRTDRCSPHGD